MKDEADNQAPEPTRRSPLWWIAATLLFVTGLIFSAYAFEYHRTWLWLGTFTAFALGGMMLQRALTPADRDDLQRVGQEYLKRRPPMLDGRLAAARALSYVSLRPRGVAHGLAAGRNILRNMLVRHGLPVHLVRVHRESNAGPVPRA